MEKGDKTYKFREFRFAVQDGDLNMIAPDYYEGQELEGDKPTKNEIFNVIADYFDLRNRDELPLSEFEIGLINRNFSWDEKQVLFGNVYTGDNSKGEFELDSNDAFKKAFSSDWNIVYPAIGNKNMASLNEDVPEEGRDLSHTSRRSAKYRNPNGPAKYFEPYKNLKFIIMDEDVSPEDVDVPVVPLRNELNQKVWTDDNELKPEVRQVLLDIANSYFESLDLPGLKVKDIYFTGSLANYGWTDGSDIDLHLIVDYGELSDIGFLEDYLYLKKKNWIDKHNISIYGFEVEPFAKDKEVEHDYKAIYSVLNNDWVVAPKKDKPTIDFETVKDKSASIMSDIDRIVDITNEDKRFKEAEKLKNKLGGLRNIGLSKGGEYSNENLIYKTLRRAGYLDKLGDAKNDAFDSKLSLNESINEKSVSKAQQRFFGAVKNCQDTGDCGSKSIKDAASSMSQGDVTDFASTKTKGLPEKVQEEEQLKNLGATPMVHTMKVQSGIDGMSPEKVGVIKDFISFVCGKLGMEESVKICLRRGRDEYIATTASYVPNDNENHVRCGGRALVDILRSLAHELVHNRQREVGIFGNGDKVQNIGGHIEDQANSVAGVFIKDFTHNYGYDNIYDI